MKRTTGLVLAGLIACGLVFGVLNSEALADLAVLELISLKFAPYIAAFVAIVFLLIAIRLVRRRAWLRLCLTALLSAAVVIFQLAPLQFTGAVLTVVRPMHFALMLPIYEMQIRTLPSDKPRIQEFNWGGMLFASYGVVYDETDEIGARIQSKQWLARMRYTDVTCGGNAPVAEVRHMIGHYYLTGFGC